MIGKIAYFLVLGKPLILYFGMITLLLFSLTALIGFLNFRGSRAISFQWHVRLAKISFIFLLIHAILGLSVYFKF